MDKLSAEDSPGGGMDSKPEAEHLMSAHTGDQVTMTISDNGLSNKKLTSSPCSIDISRPSYDMDAFNDTFARKEKHEMTCKDLVAKKCRSACQCSGQCIANRFLQWFPVIAIMRQYQWKEWILSDIIAGLCVGVIHIPQSMGFSILTSLPPIYGLYSTMYPIVIYFIFGTSRHISVGTMAVISLMIGAVVEREAEGYTASNPTDVAMETNMSDMGYNITGDTMSEVIPDEGLIQFKVDIACSVTLLVGLIQLCLYLLNLGVLSKFMSGSFIGGFMTGAACHIVTSQVPFMLGIKPPRQQGIFRLPKTWYYIIAMLPQLNVAELITSVVCIVILFVLKEIINEKFKHKLKVPIPAELIVVGLAVLISYFVGVNDKFDMRIIANVPTGIPLPRAPSMHHASTYIADAFAIAIVSYVLSMSLGKTFAQRFRYNLDRDQEMLAYGLMHTISSFLLCFGGAQAPPRTLVHVNTGGKTQLASIVCALMVLMVCVFMGPLIEPLPNSVLAAVIAVALFPLFKQFSDLPRLFRINVQDCVIWLVTFFAVVVCDVDIGLYVGITIGLVTVIVPTLKARSVNLGQSGSTELYADAQAYESLKSHISESIVIFKFESPLYFANVDDFKLGLARVVALHNNSIIKPFGNDKSKPRLKGIVLDCSMIYYADVAGVQLLKQIHSQHKEGEVPVVLANATENLVDKLETSGFDATSMTFPSIHDAAMVLSSSV